MKATLQWFLGVGGAALDPSGGAALFVQQAAALSPDLNVPPLFLYTDYQTAAADLQALPSNVAIILCGDSAGCVAVTQIAQIIHPRKVAYMAMVQSSHLMPPQPIGDNVAVVDAFYTDWWRSFPPRMGDYKPQLVTPPAGDVTYPGKYVGNRGKTTISYIYAPTYFHPADDDPATQATMLAQVKAVLAAYDRH